MAKKAIFYFTECILYVDLTVIEVIIRAAWSMGEFYKYIWKIEIWIL